MKKIKLFKNISLVFCSMFILIACGKNDVSLENEKDIEIVLNDSDTHYIKFMENNAEVLRIVVLEGETYEDLKPYFPTLTAEEGYIKYWDGDYKYTEYTVENQFSVWSSSNYIIEIYSYIRKIS